MINKKVIVGLLLVSTISVGSYLVFSLNKTKVLESNKTKEEFSGFADQTIIQKEIMANNKSRSITHYVIKHTDNNIVDVVLTELAQEQKIKAEIKGLSAKEKITFKADNKTIIDKLSSDWSGKIIFSKFNAVHNICFVFENIDAELCHATNKEEGNNNA